MESFCEVQHNHNKIATMSRDKGKPDGSQKIPKSIGDYLVLPLSLPIQANLPASIQQPILHYCYIKPDSPREPTPDTPRSLYISNCPIDSTETAFRTLFKTLHSSALVERVDFENDTDAQAPLRVLKDLGLKVGTEVSVQGTKMISEGYNGQTTTTTEGEDDDDATKAQTKKRKRRDLAEDHELLSVAREMTLPRIWPSPPLRKSGSSAVIVFVDRQAMLLALKAAANAVKNKSTAIEWVPEAAERNTGSARYSSHKKLCYPDKKVLLNTVTTYLNAFTALEQQRSRLLKTQGAVPDEDGFITVSRGAGRSAPAARMEDAQAAQEREREKAKKRVGGDFYRFQTREGRKDRERQLREGFESDRRRVAEMRERRGKVRPE